MADNISRQFWPRSDPTKCLMFFFITKALIRLCGEQTDLRLSWSKLGTYHAQIQRGPTEDPNTSKSRLSLPLGLMMAQHRMLVAL